jgi:hypothetical protein
MILKSHGRTTAPVTANWPEYSREYSGRMLAPDIPA